MRNVSQPVARSAFRRGDVKRFLSVVFRTNWGFHSSPLLEGDHLLFAQLFHSTPTPTLLITVNKANGEEAWKVKHKGGGRGENQESYASLVVYRKGDDAYLMAPATRGPHGPPPDGQLGDLAASAT